LFEREVFSALVTTSNGIGSAESTPRLRKAEFNDYQQISALGAPYGLGTETYDEWAHLWNENPVLRRMPDLPMGWVFEGEDHRIVGHLANVPLAYQLGNQKLLACASRSVMVDPQYRSYSFQLLSQFFRQKNVDLFLATTVNAQATKLYEVFRALRVPAGTWDNSAFWITNYRGFSASALKMKELPGAQALSYPAGAGLWARDAFQGRFFKARGKSTEPDFCASFDDRFQVFWQELCDRYPQRLLADRSREALDWHFKPAMAKGRTWILTLSQGAKLTAYAIFLRQDNPEHGLIRMRLVDFQTLEGQNDLLRPVLYCAFERCRRERIHMLEASGFAPEKQSVIDSLSPCGRSLDAWRYFYKAVQPSLAERLKDPAAWDPSCLDGDASL
jgi:hypothetical protein